MNIGWVGDAAVLREGSWTRALIDWAFAEGFSGPIFVAATRPAARRSLMRSLAPRKPLFIAAPDWLFRFGSLGNRLHSRLFFRRLRRYLAPGTVDALVWLSGHWPAETSCRTEIGEISRGSSERYAIDFITLPAAWQVFFDQSDAGDDHSSAPTLVCRDENELAARLAERAGDLESPASRLEIIVTARMPDAIRRWLELSPLMAGVRLHEPGRNLRLLESLLSPATIAEARILMATELRQAIRRLAEHQRA